MNLRCVYFQNSPTYVQLIFLKSSLHVQKLQTVLIKLFQFSDFCGRLSHLVDALVDDLQVLVCSGAWVTNSTAVDLNRAISLSPALPHRGITTATKSGSLPRKHVLDCAGIGLRQKHANLRIRTVKTTGTCI